ncbi:MAG: DUF1080 domain-containing protein [Planctomyces sp.]|nr:DUF1080 domain-containing protein [Planctomyces sp.]
MSHRWLFGLLLAGVLPPLGCAPTSAPPPEGAAVSSSPSTNPTQTAAGSTDAASAADGTSAAPDDFEVEPGFTLLTLADFESFPADSRGWSMRGPLLVTTGKPKGYIHSRRPYGNFTWRGEYRLLPPEGAPDAARLEQCNTGFMLCIEEPHKVWPKSLEVQGKWVEMASIKGNGGAASLDVEDDEMVRQAVRRPVGEWNSIEVQCRDGAVVAFLNDWVVCRAAAGELREGLIGLQAENDAVEFRRLRIRED